MSSRGYALVGWLCVGALGLGLCPLLWALLTRQTTSSCYGLWDGVSTARLIVMPLSFVVRQSSVWPCGAAAVAPPLIGLLLVLRRPRGWGWLSVSAGWVSYAVIATLLAGIGC